ncbi:FtsX-like permease family protein [Streptomyces sp. ML-6]|uniref:FtsX-like permease family protein n=1 Tax=Streptomyces sp. ML-6 TaxID=2982693 RepID=UPI0024BF8256|nr:FtsX-like permease family protein [Streptomyces sp. ML-6]MDK0519510.1 ABC transporter permease [Streptomyces sp. ML-6]
MTTRSVRGGTAAPCAPWVRTRLRTAPGTAWALALLVLVTSFLAALFPRAVERQGSDGLRHDIAAADPGYSALELISPLPSLQMIQSEREATVRGAALQTVREKTRDALPAEVRPGAEESSYGFGTSKSTPAQETWLPRPDGLDPQLDYTTLSDLPRHAALRSGAWPTVRGTVTEETDEVEGVITEETAKALGAKPGSTLSVPTRAGEHLTVRITGVITPREPRSTYWSVDPLLRTPALVPEPTPFPPPLTPPRHYWTATVLLAPDAGPALLGSTGEAEMFWRFAPDASGLTAADVPGVRSALASLEGGPELVRLRTVAGDNATFRTELDRILTGYETLRTAIEPVVRVAAVGVGAVAAVVLLMTAGLIGGRRREELALLRARGGSLAGMGGRLLAETAVVVVPAAALGLLAALPFFGPARLWPSVAGPAFVAALVCVAVPVGAVLPHRRLRLPDTRDDLMGARPSRLRTVAELTALVLAVGAVAGLRRRGTADGGGDLLVSAAPVLVGLIAALVLVRLLPWPLRLASRAVSRRRGAVGFLSLARAGRSSAAGALPLLALLLALTTAAFGGSVLAGVSDARDRAAVLAVGADARISGLLDTAPLPPRLVREVRETDGVRQVAAVQVVTEVPLPPAADGSGSMQNTVVLGVDPDTYAGLARATDLGPFPADRLRAGRGEAGSVVVPVLASPATAAELGDGPRDLTTPAGDLRVQVVGTVPRTAAVPGHEFLLVDSAALTRKLTTTLLVTGDPDPKALRDAVRPGGKTVSVRLRAEERATFVDTPMQRGARGIYAAAVAVGAGYALLAVLLSLLRTAPERIALLARLRTMGLTSRQGRRLLGLESLPQALPAALGGVLVGWAAITLLAPGVDLVGLALFDGPGATVPDTARLRPDPGSLVLPALGVVVLTAAMAAVQAWWAGRRGSITELRAGDPR